MSGSRATAATTTPRSAEPPRGLAVAYSGGRDSTALLHATLVAAREAGLAVHALHVHHGLSAHADAWLAHCEAQCRRWARRGLPVAFHSVRVQLACRPGDSLEAVARTARYAALRTLAVEQGVALVLLAHHQRDQAETLLLQALRGAGVAGLAGMPTSIERDGITWARPWLGHPREAVEAYVRRHRLHHIDDDSNDDPRFARNRLRLQVWPALQAAFPQAEGTLADAARWAQQAAACVADLAALDLAGCADGGVLSLAAWQRLAPHRAVQALRLWLRQAGAAAVAAAELERLMAELPAGAPARWPVKGGELRRYRGKLRFVAAPSSPEGPVERESTLVLRRGGRYRLPGWGGVLVAERVRAGGVPTALLVALSLQPRRGGEQFQGEAGRPARSLKKQYQAAAVPAWARGGPLLYGGNGRLLFVPGLGIDARVLAAPGEPQLALRWEPLPPG
jgi:tRNA(Ile)-lysidine synthase